ncbi:MAG: YbjN domain-containing protein [Moraxella sp.]|nr:YbjN domain-containing protein [Moraxella sp.]
MSNPFKKLKALIRPDTEAEEMRLNRSADDTPTPQAEPTPNPEDTAHLNPVSQRVIAWLDERQWHYQHYEPTLDDELRCHHFVVGFKNDSYQWNCIIRIFEKNQLVSLVAIINSDLPTKYHVALMTALNQINTGLNIGSLDFNPKTGDIRARLGFDAEFSLLSYRLLDSYLQGVAGLIDRAYDTIGFVLADDTPSNDPLTLWQEEFLDDDEHETKDYFLVNHTLQ